MLLTWLAEEHWGKIGAMPLPLPLPLQSLEESVSACLPQLLENAPRGLPLQPQQLQRLLLELVRWKLAQQVPAFSAVLEVAFASASPFVRGCTGFHQAFPLALPLALPLVLPLALPLVLPLAPSSCAEQAVAPGIVVVA
jgi:hypothetical protein